MVQWVAKSQMFARVLFIFSLLFRGIGKGAGPVERRNGVGIAVAHDGIGNVAVGLDGRALFHGGDEQNLQLQAAEQLHHGADAVTGHLAKGLVQQDKADAVLALLVDLQQAGADGHIEGSLVFPSDDSRNAKKRSIWSFRHLKYGVITIFFYVGTEVGIGNNMNLHAMDLMGQGYNLSPALLATLYWGGFMIGRMVSAGLKNVAPRPMLLVVTVAAIVLMSISMFTENLWLMAAVGLFHSVMWSCIFTLAVDGLKEYTSKASGVFMMGVFGGAVFPVLQGLLADYIGSWQFTWFVPLFCEFVILWYGLVGYKKQEA